MKIKVFLFSSLMLLQLTNSYAQNEKQEKEFLNWFFREHQKLNGKVFYLAAIATDKLSYLRIADLSVLMEKRPYMKSGMGAGDA